jgi:hypothetical protein
MSLRKSKKEALHYGKLGSIDMTNVIPGVNDLETLEPDLSKEWHLTKNGTLSPKDVTLNSGVKVWWKCTHGHEWKTSVVKRTKRNFSCPYCKNTRASPGNCLAIKNPLFPAIPS